MNRIKEVLLEQGRSQKWLAEKVKKSPNSINSYVQNRTQPSIDILYKIAKILDINPKDLLIDKNESNA